jgi:steroid 5-alpha reductase family enzyme
MAYPEGNTPKATSLDSFAEPGRSRAMAILILTAAVTFLAFTALWALSLKLRDASIVDIYWGPGFAVIAWLALGLSGITNAYTLMVLAALTLWALRLGWHILRRHRGEDARYRAMREAHRAAFGRKSLWMVFWLQALIQWLASSPVLTLALAGPPLWISGGSILAVALFAHGCALFVIGFALEAWADWRMERFKADPANRGKLLMSGLHARIRHPNYLGEIILQAGFGLMAFALTLNPLAFVGPALMAALIIRLSGVPMLEAQLAKRNGFAEWKARSGALWWKGG